ncbi:maleylpyruvate isomerase family mycothiol-dependent enzyme [Kitasatospora sp. NPDC093558]|uniref:maleylpyruvate isomerase family mycothiol-dependent enzyme n=1 Tax=Kitasatospora sp. NPDC093558 TaxID=3155201 RepID=UPI0034425EDF
MEISEHIDALRREGTLLADAAARAGLTAPVPTCPDWQVADLLRHVGVVHRWATAHPAHGLREPLNLDGENELVGPMPSDAALLDWYREGHAALVDTLVAAPADVDCWFFLPAPSPLAFWARRQAHETAIHRLDADAAAGAEGPRTDTALALDGVDELLRGFLVRPRSTLRSEKPRTVLIRATDGHSTGPGTSTGPSAWQVTISEEPVVTTALANEADGANGADEKDLPADLTIAGPAHELYPLLWNRVPAERAGATTYTGDEDLLRLWRETAVIG